MRLYMYGLPFAISITLTSKSLRALSDFSHRRKHLISLVFPLVVTTAVATLGPFSLFTLRRCAGGLSTPTLKVPREGSPNYYARRSRRLHALLEELRRDKIFEKWF